jgi:ketosteroid isomerase-like protein
MARSPAFDAETILPALAARAAGHPEALDGLWAPESTSWRSYDGRESVMSAEQRLALAKAEWSLFRQAMPDFEWDSELLLAGGGSQIVELASWKGSNGGAEAAHVDLCLVYRLTAGRIVRVEMYCDERQMLGLQNILKNAHHRR